MVYKGGSSAYFNIPFAQGRKMPVLFETAFCDNDLNRRVGAAKVPKKSLA